MTHGGGTRLLSSVMLVGALQFNITRRPSFAPELQRADVILKVLFTALTLGHVALAYHPSTAKPTGPPAAAAQVVPGATIIRYDGIGSSSRASPS